MTSEIDLSYNLTIKKRYCGCSQAKFWRVLSGIWVKLTLKMTSYDVKMKELTFQA